MVKRQGQVVDGPKKILVCRRDNIGDLVLTTPLVAAIVEAQPGANIDVLVHSYTKEVLEPFPGIRHVFAYKKAKHASGLIDKWKAWVGRMALYWALRQEQYDWMVLVDQAQKEKNRWLCKTIRPRALFSLDDECPSGEETIFDNVRLSDGLGALPSGHEAVRALSLLTRMPGVYRAELPRIYVSNPRELFSSGGIVTERSAGSYRFHIHLSARRVKQRWGVDLYVKLAQALLQKYPPSQLAVTWAPGSPDDRLHPGDDHLAKLLEEQLAGKVGSLARVDFCRTDSLHALKAILVSRSLSVCPDGGAMHLAAGLGVPVVALFGDSPPNRWAPTSPHSLVLRSCSGHVEDIALDTVLCAVDQVLGSPERH